MSDKLNCSVCCFAQDLVMNVNIGDMSTESH